MDGHKDEPPAMLWGGIIAPGAILSLVLTNLVMRKVYWFSQGGPDPIVVYTGLWPIVGTIVIKLGFAGAFSSWFLLSNLEQTERYGPLLTLVCAAVTATGFVIFLGSVL